MTRWLFLVSAALNAVLLTASPGIALTTATSQGVSICAAHSSTPTNFSFGPIAAEIVTLGCDRIGANGTGPFTSEVQSVVVLNTGLGIIPVADVQLSLVLLRGLSAGVGGNLAFGQAQVDYEADIRLVSASRPAPFASRIPVIVSGQWSIETQLVAASVEMSALQARTPTTTDEGGSDGFFLPAALLNGSLQNFGGTAVVQFDAWRGVPIQVRIEAICDAKQGGILRGPRECQAVIDPVIEFDQAAFDATWGANSFVLADYYAVGLSANLPEPGTATLFALGLFGLAGWHRRVSRISDRSEQA